MEIKLRDLMSRHFEWAGPEDPLLEAARRMQRLNQTLLPVCQNDRVVGGVRSADIEARLSSMGRDPMPAKVRDVMNPEVVCAIDEQDMRDVILMMREKRLQAVPVVDSDHRLVGMYTLGA